MDLLVSMDYYTMLSIHLAEINLCSECVIFFSPGIQHFTSLQLCESVVQNFTFSTTDIEHCRRPCAFKTELMHYTHFKTRSDIYLDDTKWSL